MAENAYVYWAVTGAVSLMGSAVIFFVRRGMDKQDKRLSAQEERARELDGKINKLTAELPFIYTTREDFIRVTASHDRKLDQIIAMLSAHGPQPPTP